MRFNHDIVAPEVLLIDADEKDGKDGTKGKKGTKIGEVSLSEALDIAQARGLDLVEIDPTKQPVVCKLVDYGQYRYNESKKRHRARAHQKQIEVKEVKFHLVISEADYDVKRRRAERFLTQGNRVKASIWFRGREISKQEIGLQRLQRFAEDLSPHADVEQQPNLLGKSMSMLLVPKRKKKPAQADAGGEAKKSKKPTKASTKKERKHAKNENE